MTCRQDNLKIPKRSDLKRLHDRMCTLRDRPMTEDEVNREVAARQKTNPAKKQRTVLQISSLYSSMQLALRRKDLDMAEHLAGQIRDLGGDPATGALAEGKAADKYDDLIGRINENNRQRTKVAMQRAHENSIAKRKAEHAIVMAKQ
jgi:RNA polymerase-associated protein RTF1